MIKLSQIIEFFGRKVQKRVCNISDTKKSKNEYNRTSDEQMFDIFIKGFRRLKKPPN